MNYDLKKFGVTGPQGFFLSLANSAKMFTAVINYLLVFNLNDASTLLSRVNVDHQYVDKPHQLVL
jgi:hypothetical protein